jgi:nicotinamide mononucleotide transporter
MGDLIEQLRQWSPFELAAVTSALLYLVLAIRQNILCWLFAGISTAIYVYLFVVARLYMESALNVFYFAMAIYGFSVWYRGRTPGAELPVTVWPKRAHGVAIGAILLASLASGYLLDTRTDAAFPYIDSLTILVERPRAHGSAFCRLRHHDPVRSHQLDAVVS